MISLLLSRSAALVYLATFAVTGLLVAYIGFCDPDTCWHLALGQWMVQHHALPQTDPFSSNVAVFVQLAPGLPLIQHEWLSDVIFYSLYQTSGLSGLLVFVSLLSSLSLILLPAFNLQRQDVPRLLIICLCMLAVLASGFRLWVRPEQLSFLCFSLLILLHGAALRTADHRKALSYGLSVFFIMVLWTNLHALFLLGITYCAGYFILTLLVPMLRRPLQDKPCKALLLLLSSVIATLFTPWQMQLWFYFSRLLHSSAPYSNKENGPITIMDLTHPTFFPLITFLSLVWGVILFYGNRRPVKDFLEPGLLSLAGMLILFLFRRLTPPGLLIMLYAVGLVFVRQSEKQDSSIFSATDHWLKKFGLPFSKISFAVGLFTSAIVCLLSSTFWSAPQLPAPSKLFRPPYEAVRYLESHPQPGRLLNDSKFGSMMTWVMKKTPDIFIDGRFDSFSRKIVSDYNAMRLCKPGWKELMGEYKIGCVFFAPDAPIVQNLEASPDWQDCYRDRTAVVLTRKRMQNFIEANTRAHP